MENSSLIKLENVSFSYDNKTILDNITFDFKKGTFLGLVGPNGSGKTTLIKLILGLIKPSSGKISLFGTPLNKFKEWEKIGYISQKSNSFNSGFPATVFEVVSMGLVSKIGLFRFMSKSDKRKVFDAIDTVGMSNYQHKNIGELSGGQQQRVFIARALVSDPELLILDEPTVGVDLSNVKSFYSLLRQLNETKNISLLMVTHDIEIITEHANQVACINKSIHFHKVSEELKAKNEKEISLLSGYPIQTILHNQ